MAKRRGKVKRIKKKFGDPYRSVRREVAPVGHAILTGKEYSRKDNKKAIEEEITIDEN